MAQGRVKELESLFHRSEAELAAALSDKHSLESDVAELRAQLAKVGLEVAGMGGSWDGQGTSRRCECIFKDIPEETDECNKETARA